MTQEFAVYYLPKVIIGASFIWAALWVAWLWTHRRGDWPKAWALLLVSAYLGSSGTSRILHGADLRMNTLAVFDWLTAVVGVVAGIFLPWAVYALRSYPSLKEIEHALKGNAQRHIALAAAREAQRRKDRADRLSNLLIALFKQSPALPEQLKQEVNEVIRELKGDSDPESDSAIIR